MSTARQAQFRTWDASRNGPGPEPVVLMRFTFKWGWGEKSKPTHSNSRPVWKGDSNRFPELVCREQTRLCGAREVAQWVEVPCAELTGCDPGILHDGRKELTPGSCVKTSTSTQNK